MSSETQKKLVRQRAEILRELTKLTAGLAELGVRIDDQASRLNAGGVAELFQKYAKPLESLSKANEALAYAGYGDDAIDSTPSPFTPPVTGSYADSTIGISCTLTYTRPMVGTTQTDTLGSATLNSVNKTWAKLFTPPFANWDYIFTATFQKMSGNVVKTTSFRSA